MIISFNVMFVVMMSHSFLFLKNKFFLFFFFKTVCCNCMLSLWKKLVCLTLLSSSSYLTLLTDQLPLCAPRLWRHIGVCFFWTRLKKKMATSSGLCAFKLTYLDPQKTSNGPHPSQLWNLRLVLTHSPIWSGVLYFATNVHLAMTAIPIGAVYFL